MSEIQITDRELFEIIGRSQVEVFSKDRELTAYQQQFEKVKEILAEAEPLKAANTALETSNKQLSEKNIQLDQALTEARKERDQLRVTLTAREQDLAKAKADCDMAQSSLELARQELIASKKALEVERGKHDQSPARSRGKSSHA